MLPNRQCLEGECLFIADLCNKAVISYHLLRRRAPYAELGTAPVDEQQVTRQRRWLVEQLVGLGVKVTVEEAAVAL